MITRSDLQKAGGEVTAEQRRRLGDPPTPEQLDAYMRGELNAEEEDRIRDLLVAYPELARGIGADFPEDEVRPGEPGYVSEQVIAQRLAALHNRMDTAAGAHRERGRVVQFRSSVPFTLAAALALVLAGLYWHTQSRLRVLQDEVNRPRAVSIVQLRPGGQRGGDHSLTLDPAREDMQRQLSIVMSDMAHYDAYSVDIVDGSGKVVWPVSSVRRIEDVALITLPANALRSGRYDVNLYGIAGRTKELMETYSIRVP